jgi:hypothetical protein
MQYIRNSAQKNTAIKYILIVLFSIANISCTSLKLSGNLSSNSLEVLQAKNSIKISKELEYKKLPIVISSQIVSELYNVEKPETVLTSIEILFW